MKTRIQILLTALAFIATTHLTRAGNVVWINTNGGNWSVGNNWNPHHPPGASDIAVITNAHNYTVTLDVSTSVSGLILGTTNAGSTQTLSINGQTFTLNGQATVSSNGQFNLSSGTFIGATNTGGAVFSGVLAPSGGALAGKLTMASNGVLNLAGTSATNVLSGLTLLTNYGTVIWSNTDLYGSSSLQIFNHGLWDAQANNIFYGSGTVFNNSGTFRKSAGGGITTLDNNTTFNSTNTVDVESATLTIQKGTCSGTFNTASGTILNFGSSPSIVTFSLTGNTTFTGAGIVEGYLNGYNALIGGTVTCSAVTLLGSMTISNTGMLNFVGTLGANTFSSITFTNFGTVNWSNTDLYSGCEIDNYGLWDAKTNNTFYGGNGTTFNNYGTFRKSGGTLFYPGTYLDNKVAFNNFGTVDVQIGSLFIWGGSGGGVFNVAVGANLNFWSYELAGNTSFTGNGFVGGGLTGSNAVLNGTLTFMFLNLSGTVTIASNCVVTLTNTSGSVTFSGILTNYGTVVWSGGDLRGYYARIDNYGLWDAKTSSTFYGGNPNGITTFNNFGTFRKSGNPQYAYSFLDNNVIFNNSGTVDVQIGGLSIFGSYALAGGTLNFAINSSNDFGSINLNGNAALTGTLSVNLNNNYTPGAGSSFALLSYGSETGIFTKMNLPHLSRLMWQTNYGVTTFTLSVTSAPPLLWTQTGASNAWWTSVASSADGSKLVASAGFYSSGYPNGIYISTNSGATWQLSTNANGWLEVGCSADGSRLVAANSFPSGNTTFTAPHTSTNSGATWQSGQFVFMGDAGTIASSADGRVLIIGLVPSHPLVSTNWGQTWSQISLDGGCYVACSADGTKLFTAGRNYAGMSPLLQSHLNISTNSGMTWQVSSNAPYTTDWSSIACSADGEKVIGSLYEGSIYTSTNSGQTWVTNNVPATTWQSVAMSADGTRMIATFGDSNNGGIYTSTNSETSWMLNNPTNLVWYSAASSADGNKMVAIGAARNVYSLGGIYNFYFLPMPSLCITSTNSNVRLSWIFPSTNFVLQQSADLFNWLDLTNMPALNLSNLENQVFLPLTGSNVFYRLKTP